MKLSPIETGEFSFYGQPIRKNDICLYVTVVPNAKEMGVSKLLSNEFDRFCDSYKLWRKYYYVGVILCCNK